MRPSSDDKVRKITLTPGNFSLGQAAFSGTIWLFGGKTYRQILFLVRAAVLARLLAPQDFGLVGLGELCIQFLGVFSYTGFGEALVQRPHLPPKTLQTAWWVGVGRQTFICLALYLSAPWVATHFHEPSAVPILRAMAFIQFLSGLTSVGLVLLTKEMRFRPLFNIDASGLTIDLLVAVSIAILWPSVWALVLGALAGTFARLVLSYIVYPHRPSFTFDYREAFSLFTFGQWLFLSAIMFFLISKGMDFFSGLLFGAAALGLYQMASRFALLPSNHLGEVLLNSLFPAYSLIQEDAPRLRAAFIRVLQLATFVIFPLSTLMAVAIGPALPLLLGPKWQEVVNLVSGLAFGGAVQALLRTGSPLFMATASPSCQFAMDMASSCGIMLCLWPFAHLMGLPGLAWSYALGICFGLPLWWRFVMRQGHLTSYELFISIVPAIMASGLMATGIYVSSRMLHLQFVTFASLPWLLGLMIFGASIYLGVILLAERMVHGYHPIQASLSLIQVVSSRRRQ